MPVVAQTGALSTGEAVELSRHAQAAGASVLMVVTPYCEPLTLDETLRYLRTVADAVDIPITLTRRVAWGRWWWDRIQRTGSGPAAVTPCGRNVSIWVMSGANGAMHRYRIRSAATGGIAARLTDRRPGGRGIDGRRRPRRGRRWCSRVWTCWPEFRRWRGRRVIRPRSGRPRWAVTVTRWRRFPGWPSGWCGTRCSPIGRPEPAGHGSAPPSGPVARRPGAASGMCGISRGRSGGRAMTPRPLSAPVWSSWIRSCVRRYGKRVRPRAWCTCCRRASRCCGWPP
ncbi:dihydrodipicolinate synthase family protein [Streptomyces malaysiensis]|uniref:dihydrodipicolinate synthase family protein n=1 Tax=Streptomyces malaysiensis TaxID=92644 RepID=UPI002B2A9B9F|nr:dihydrodipicolinate synthase family protein [Streptomyces malaysiensis]